MFLFAILGTVLAACSGSAPTYPGGLQLDVYPLAAAPEPVPLTFQPQNATQEEVLAKHAGERAKVLLNPVQTVQGQPVMQALGDGEELTAVVRSSSEDPLRQIVDVIKGNEVLFTTDAGLPSPVMPLQALWAYDDHWVLEILFSEEEIWKGEIFRDGELLNDLKGYDESFGFQLLASEPFYFYQRGDTVGFSYAGEEKDLPYNRIPHYYCCGESTLNPIHSENMVAFFAQQDEEWFYLELGAFED
ncbi:MAG: hypothetical protein ACQEQQ_11550 [Chloroflexota bacterium]